MAFGVTVNRRAGSAMLQDPRTEWDEALAIWFREQYELYENPIAGGSTFFDHWRQPAMRLNLNLLSRVYDQGLSIDGAQLGELLEELRHLEAYWKTCDFSDCEPLLYTEIGEKAHEGRLVPMEEHLFERLGYLREAIQVARKHDAVLSVG